LNIRAKARTYPRGNANGRDNSSGERRSRFPERMTERKARATTTATPTAEIIAAVKEEADSQRE
jgi:hypothetical protein